MVLFLLFIISFNVYSTDHAPSDFQNNEQKIREAVRNVQKVVTDHYIPRHYKKNAEKIVIDTVGKDTSLVVGALYTVTVTKRINTNQIKNLNAEFLGGRISPSINYDLNNGNVFATIGFTKNFD